MEKTTSDPTKRKCVTCGNTFVREASHASTKDPRCAACIADRWLVGSYTTQQAEGAWPNGARVQKTRFGDGDKHAVGSQATVHGSLGPVSSAEHPHLEGVYGYFLEWDETPGIAVFCTSDRLGRVLD